MSSSNADKQKHGQSAQLGLESILNACHKNGYIAAVSKPYRVGMSGFFSNSQFYVPFLITFQDDTQWALFTTTSMRTDRIKGQQWDASNLKAIVSSIKKVFLIYPDACPEEEAFKRQNEKYEKKYEYSAIDGIISQNQIANMIESYALKDKTAGRVKDIQGNYFEKKVATLLSYPDNLNKWKLNSPLLEGINYGIFRMIVDCFNLNPNRVESISATSDKSVIGKLPSGGNPKTDVLVEVKDKNSNISYFTISCKCSSENVVSVHQYTADTFADVLNSNDETLRTLLREFQAAGSMSSFGEEKCQQLQKALKPYLNRLIPWVLGGIGGGGNPITQCANYILTYDNSDDTIGMHSLNEYCELLIARNINGNFGTPFSWTYPSKRRGKSIQLKCRIIK